MPRFDGTGPNGAGPMTGGGRGNCALPAGSTQRPVRSGFFGRGRGWGRGFGRGWGRGFGGYGTAYSYAYGNPYYGDPYAPEFTPQQEAAGLKAEAKLMQDDINAMNQRIKELESNSAPEEK